MRSDRERLLDITQAVERINKYTRHGRKEFESQELVQTWVIHHFEIIGEAAGRTHTNFASLTLRCRGQRSLQSETFSRTTT